VLAFASLWSESRTLSALRSQTATETRFVSDDGGQYDLYLTKAGDTLFLRADKDCTVQDSKVLFSFGGGEWMDGLEAREAMAEVDGRWLSMQISSLKQRIVIDKKSCVPPFDKLDLVKNSTLTTLEEVLDAFVNCGEVGILMTHHNLTRTTNWAVTPKDDLCFQLDAPKTAPKDPKTKKGKGKTKKEPKAKKGAKGKAANADKESDPETGEKAPGR
jgi:hypothetical protein